MKNRSLQKIEIEKDGIVFYFEGSDQGFIVDEFKHPSLKRTLLLQIENAIQEFNENNVWY